MGEMIIFIFREDSDSESEREEDLEEQERFIPYRADRKTKYMNTDSVISNEYDITLTISLS